MHFPYRVAVGVKPLDGFHQSIPQTMSGLKTKELLGAADIKTSPRLAVRLVGVPIYSSRKPDISGDHSGKIPNRHLFTRSEVDGEIPIILFRCEQDTFCGILHIQKFPSR